MHRDYLESRVLTDRKAQKSNIERSGFQHLYLIYCEDIAKEEFYFCIQLPKLTNDCGHNLITSCRYESDPQNPQLPVSRQLCLMNSLSQGLQSARRSKKTGALPSWYGSGSRRSGILTN